MDRRPPPPLTTALLVRAAQTYLARRAASRLQLGRVLLRKAGRLGGDGDERDPEQVQALVEAAVERVAQAGWLDDASLAQARAASLQRNGFPARTVRRRLAQQGLVLDEINPKEATVDDDAQARRYAERKRLGPFASGRREPSPDRDLRAMIRAGFSPDVALRAFRALAEETGSEGSGQDRHERLLKDRVTPGSTAKP